MLQTMNVQDGSLWIEECIRHGIKNSWGPEKWVVRTVVDAQLVMPDYEEHRWPHVQVKVVAFMEGRGVVATNVLILEEEVSQDGFYKAGLEIAEVLKKALYSQREKLGLPTSLSESESESTRENA